jgi:hypothetical protein
MEELDCVLTGTMSGKFGELTSCVVYHITAAGPSQPGAAHQTREAGPGPSLGEARSYACQIHDR